MVRETVKAIVVRCGNCGEKQLWSEDMTWRHCTSCGSMVVLKTISQTDLDNARDAMKQALKELGHPEPKSVTVAYSDYTTYVLSIEDIERLKLLSREAKKLEKEAVEGRAFDAREEMHRQGMPQKRAAKKAKPAKKAAKPAKKQKKVKAKKSRR